MNSLKMTLIAAFCAATYPQMVLANDDALYGAAAPDDAAFVRFIGHTDHPIAPLFNFDFSQDVTGTDFVVIAAELLSGVEAGTYVTVIVSSDGTVQSIREPARDSLSKVNLFLLNATDNDASLLIAENGAEVIGDVAAGRVGMRAVNPVSTTLSVEDVSFEVSLSRGQDVTFAVLPSGPIMIPTTFGNIVTAD